MKTLITASLLALLGFQGALPVQAAGDDIQSGDHLILERSIQIPPFGKILYIQQGETMSVRDVQELEVHCMLYMQVVAEVYLDLQPDTFTITSVRHSYGDYGALPGRMYAQNDSGSISQWFHRVDFGIQSPRQPDVMTLSCQVDRNQASGMALETVVSRAEVETALGGLFRIE